MSIAKRIVTSTPVLQANEVQKLEKIRVADEDEREWLYERTSNPVDQSLIAHIRWEYMGKGYVPSLSRGADNDPILKQEAPGLPERILVHLGDPPNHSTVTHLAQEGATRLDAGRNVEFALSPGEGTSENPSLPN